MDALNSPPVSRVEAPFVLPSSGVLPSRSLKLPQLHAPSFRAMVNHVLRAEMYFSFRRTGGRKGIAEAVSIFTRCFIAFDR